MSQLDQPIGLVDILRLQGVEPSRAALQKARRFFRRRERAAGIQLLFQAARGGHYHTTLALLRRHATEIFDLAQEEQSGMKRLNSEIDSLRKEIEGLKGRSEAQKTRLRSLAAEVRTLRASFTERR